MSEWFIVSTNPRCEARALRSLAEAGFNAYAPTLRKLIVHHRSKKKIPKDFPLLRGYLFLEMPASARHWGFVRKCDGVKGVLGYEGRPLSIPAADVEAFRSRELAGEWDAELRKQYRAHDFTEGQDLRVKDGPFTGFVAHVVDASGQKAIRALIQIFGRATEMSIPFEFLEAA